LGNRVVRMVAGHFAIRGTLSRALVKQLTAATYTQV
jgi:hypothetical protein